jgi:hypothetical protein
VDEGVGNRRCGSNSALAKLDRIEVKNALFGKLTAVETN